jgi:hypothetical protein
LLEASFDILETGELDRFNLSKYVPMVIAVRIVVADDTPIVAGVQSMVDVGQVVTCDTSLTIHPDFTTQ